MKLLTLPPLMLLCSELLLRPPVILATAPPTPVSNWEQPAAQVVYTRRRPSHVIFHPATHSCVIRDSLNDSLKLGPCDQSDNWEYTPQNFLVVKGTYFCLQAVQPGKPAQLGIICSEPDSSWDINSNVKTQISAEQPEGGGVGGSLCLDVDATSNTLMTNPCLCLSSVMCEPGSQWFQFSTRSEVEGSQITHLDPYTAQDSP